MIKSPLCNFACKGDFGEQIILTYNLYSAINYSLYA